MGFGRLAFLGAPLAPQLGEFTALDYGQLTIPPGVFFVFLMYAMRRRDSRHRGGKPHEPESTHVFF